MKAAACVTVALVVLLSASASSATTSITQPHGNPYHVALNGNAPKVFTISVSGFRPGTLVYVEQCNNRSPSADNWAPARDCDLGSSPAAAIVSSTGTATFSAGDRNHAFHPFTGSSPQGLFNCLTSSEASPHNGMPDYRRCQIRVSSNNFAATTDQVFLPIVLGSSSSAAGSSSRVPALLLILAFVALLVVAALTMRRRSTARTR